MGKVHTKKKNKKAAVKHSIQELFDARDGGQIALRGYSYQFLYSCYLALSVADDNTSLCLEGVEDIDRITLRPQEKAVSHIQLKFSKDRQDASFMKPILKNFLEAYLLDSNRDFKLVYDFPVATGNLSKLIEGKLDDNSISYWNQIVDELRVENSLWNWDGFNSKLFFSLLSFERIEKCSLEQEIEKLLIDKYDITTDNIKLFANSIKILCFEKMQNRACIDKAEMDLCIQSVKNDISKGPQNPAHSWIRRIVFHQNDENDTKSFYEGKKATPADIASEIPLHRTGLEQSILVSIRDKRVTIIKASSGQGKTTLALQAAFLLKDEYTPYQVLLCDDYSKLGNISQFFISRIKVGEKPLIILDNLDRQLSGWNSLVQLMESEIHHHFRILVTTRETDWYNYSGDISSIQSIRIIKPTLCQEEAKDLFFTLKKVGLIHKTILSWEKAWSQISDRQLLIEYIYLLTHGEMLSERISAQMAQIGSSPEGNAKCELLRKVCFADVCGIRLSTKMLAKCQIAPSDCDFGEMLKSMENEFLIHVNKEGSFIEGLHPVRSKHIVDRLHQFVQLEETALAILRIVNPSDLAMYFSHLPEFNFEKASFYKDAVETLWNTADLSHLISAMHGLFSGNTMEYFQRNRTIFDDADKHEGLYILSTELCPFIRFKELDDEEPRTLDKMQDMFPKDSNIAYLRNLRDSIPPIQLKETDFYALCCSIYKKITECGFYDITDAVSLSAIVELLYNVDSSLNLSSKIPLAEIWSSPQAYSIECMSSFMYVSYLGNRENYMRCIESKLHDIFSYIVEQTQSLRIYTDDGKDAIHVDYVLRLNDSSRANEESVSRLSFICKMLPFYSYYCADGIKPTINVLSGYTVHDDSHKEMPARNLIIMFHKDLNSLWIKTVLSNYEFDTVAEWLTHWFDTRDIICQLAEKCCNCLYKLLSGRNLGGLAEEYDQYREKLSAILRREARYPKEDRPFIEKETVPEGIARVKNDYFQSMQNFFNQFIGVVKKEPKEQNLALYNLRVARSALRSMQLYFSSIPMDKALELTQNRLDSLEEPLLDKLYASCLYYQNHLASKVFDKYKISTWYTEYKREELNQVKQHLNELRSICSVVFPEKAYYKKAFSYYPVVIHDLDKLQKDTQGSWILYLLPFCDDPYDYLVILKGESENILGSSAICVPKNMLEQVRQSIESGRELSGVLSQPYPVEVTEEMTDCFATSFEIISEVTTDLNSSSVVEIAEALWVYAKYASVSVETGGTDYIKNKLSSIREEIEQKLDLMEDKSKRDELRAVCKNVFSGQAFGDEKLNSIVESTLIQ